LLSSSLDTFEKLEVALELARSPAHTSSIGELTTALQMPRDHIERGVQGLRDLCWLDAAGGLLRLDPPPVAAPAFAALRRLYDEDRALIAQAISDVAMEKIRGMAARAFSEAFTAIRKKGGSGQQG